MILIVYQACADRLKREIEEFGPDPQFDVIRGKKEEAKEEPEVKEEVSETKLLKPQRRANVHIFFLYLSLFLTFFSNCCSFIIFIIYLQFQAKTAQKGASAEKYQYEIMESSGIDREEIPKFCDPKYWLEVFPPRTQVIF